MCVCLSCGCACVSVCRRATQSESRGAINQCDPQDRFTIECQCCARVVERGGPPVRGVRSARCATRSRTRRETETYIISCQFLPTRLRAVGCSCLRSPTLEWCPSAAPPSLVALCCGGPSHVSARVPASDPLSAFHDLNRAHRRPLSLSLSLVHTWWRHTSL